MENSSSNLIDLNNADICKFVTPKGDKVRYVISSKDYWVIVNPHSPSITSFRNHNIDESLSVKVTRRLSLTQPEDLVSYNKWSTTIKKEISYDEISDIKFILYSFPVKVTGLRSL